METKEEERLRLQRERVKRYALRHPDRIKKKSKWDYQKLKQDPARYDEYIKNQTEKQKENRINDLAYRIGYGQYNASNRRKAVPIKIRRDLIERENGLCQHRDNSLCKGSLGTHHIDGNPENNELPNLMLLCRSHHKSISH